MKNTTALFKLITLITLLMAGLNSSALYAQQSCSDKLTNEYFKNLEQDGVLISAEKRTADSANLRPKSKYRDLHNDDKTLRADLQSLNIFSDCSFELADNNLQLLNSESVTALGSRIVKDKNISNVNFSLQPDFIRPVDNGFQLPSAEKSFRILKFSSNSLNDWTSKMGVKSSNIIKSKITGELSSTNTKQRMLSVLSGSFDTYQGAFADQINKDQTFPIEGADFFMSLWNNPEKRGPQYSLIRRITGMIIQNSSDYLGGFTGNVASDVNTTFGFAFISAGMTLNTLNKFSKEVSDTKKTYSFYRNADSIDYAPLPTNKAMCKAFENSFTTNAKINTQEIDLDLNATAEVKIHFEKLPKSVGNELTVAIARIDKDPQLSKVCYLSALPNVTYDQNSAAADLLLYLKKQPDFFAEASSELSKTGYAFLPIDIFCRRVWDTDTLFALRSERDVKLILKNYPTITNQDNILTMTAVDSVNKTYKFQGNIYFDLASNQTLSDPNPQFFTQLDSITSINNGSKLQVAFNKANVQRSSANIYQVAVNIPFEFAVKNNIARYRLTASVPVKQGVLSSNPRRYVNIILDGSMPAIQTGLQLTH